MKAVAYKIPGPIDRENALQDINLEVPKAEDRDLLVKIIAAIFVEQVKVHARKQWVRINNLLHGHPGDALVFSFEVRKQLAHEPVPVQKDGSLLRRQQSRGCLFLPCQMCSLVDIDVLTIDGVSLFILACGSSGIHIDKRRCIEIDRSVPATGLACVLRREAGDLWEEKGGGATGGGALVGEWEYPLQRAGAGGAPARPALLGRRPPAADEGHDSEDVRLPRGRGRRLLPQQARLPAAQVRPH